MALPTPKDKRIDMTGLEKVEGLSFEQIKELLDNENITYSLAQEPEYSQHYFRESHFIFPFQSKEEVLGILESYELKRRVKKDIYSYFVYYQVGKDFNTIQLNKGIKWKDGKLIEIVRLEYNDILYKSQVKINKDQESQSVTTQDL